MTGFNRIDCKRVIEQVVAHLESDPQAPLSAELEAHLRECSECHRRTEMEKRLLSRTDERLTCEEVMELLFEYLDQAVDDDLNRRIEHHLSVCRDCFSRTLFETRLRAKVRDSSATQAPVRLQRRIKKLLDRF